MGITTNPNTVRDNVIELDVVSITTTVSNDLNFVVKILHFSIVLFGFVVFIFEVCNHFFNVFN